MSRYTATLSKIRLHLVQPVEFEASVTENEPVIVPVFSVEYGLFSVSLEIVNMMPVKY